MAIQTFTAAQVLTAAQMNALHAALPLLSAKQRPVEPWDSMADDHTVICPDPAGNVIMRIGFEQQS